MRKNYQVHIYEKENFKNFNPAGVYRGETEADCMSYIEMYVDVRFAVTRQLSLIAFHVYHKNSRNGIRYLYKRNAFDYGTLTSKTGVDKDCFI